MAPARLRDLLAEAAARLAQAGVPTARLDAEVLAGHVLGLDRLGLRLEPDREVDGPAAAKVRELVRQRALGRPAAYLLGEKEFWGLPFFVTSDTLVPRPETEHLVEEALAALPADAPLRLADLGAGAGVLAVSLAVERPACRVLAADVSAPALAVARRNAARHGVLDRVGFLRADFRRLPLPDACLDLVVSNPPYVSEAELAAASPEVREHEPRLALAAGPEGLDLIRGLVPEAARVLRPGGMLLVEMGCGQAAAVAALFREADFGEVRVVRDLAGLDRITAGRRPG